MKATAAQKNEIDGLIVKHLAPLNLHPSKAADMHLRVRSNILRACADADASHFETYVRSEIARLHPAKTVKLANSATGFYYKVGENFTCDCVVEASVLEPQQAAVVKASFENVVELPGDTHICYCEKHLGGESHRDEEAM